VAIELRRRCAHEPRHDVGVHARIDRHPPGFFAQHVGEPFRSAQAAHGRRSQRHWNRLAPQWPCPEPTRSSLRSQLRSYALSRAELFSIANYNRVEESAKGQSFRDAIWRDASLVAASDPHSIQAGLLIQSMNDVIDMHTRRDVANTNHVPEPVWWLLILIMLVAMGMVGVTDAQGSQSTLIARVVLAVALSATLSLTLDLDRPQRGVIRVSQAPMRALYDSMGSD
jgi:hypothetical protein